MMGILEKYWKPLVMMFLVATAFIAGNVWSDRGWEKSGQNVTAQRLHKQQTRRLPPG